VTNEAAEVIDGHEHSKLLLTCEHASGALPAPWTWPEADLWLVDTHWAIDLGIADLTRALASAIHAPAVLARFSRLLIDANRDVHAETSIRKEAEGHLVHLNQEVTDEERAQRISRFHEPYHAAIDAALSRYHSAVVLSMHSFTPVYEKGPPRTMEIGVLFDEEEELSMVIAEGLAKDGWAVALNEPYSGKAGLIYAAGRHAKHHGRRALELEIRQDLAVDEARRPALVASLRSALARVGLAL
jgi:predicted N-formylglutamate amidohydrolase